MLALACAVGCAMVGRAMTMRAAQTLAGIWLAVALLSCVMALLQYLGLEHWCAPWISQAGDGTAFANLRQRNQFASLTGIGLLSLVMWRNQAAAALPAHPAPASPWMSAPHLQRFNYQRWWPWATLLLLAAGNAATTSRTGLVQWLALALLGWCWRAQLSAGARAMLVWAVPAYAAMAVLVPQLAAWAAHINGNILNRMADTTGGGRVALYSNVWELILQQPWLGWGWRELAYAHYAQHFETRFPDILDNAHNLPLHLAVELGLPGAALLCACALVWVWRSKPWRESVPSRQLAWGVLLLIALHSLTEYPLWYGPFLMTAGLCVGLLLVPIKENKTRIAPVFIAQAAIILIAFTAYASWDYARVSQIYLSPEARSTRPGADPLVEAQSSVLFARQARFAELVTTPLTRQSAPRVLALSAELVHYSPEPRVIQALIESATMLHFDDVALFHLARFREVFPKEHAAWSALKTP